MRNMILMCETYLKFIHSCVHEKHDPECETFKFIHSCVHEKHDPDV